MLLSLDTEPSGLALSWDDEVAGHLRIDVDHPEKARILSTLVPAAMEWCESITGRQLLTATYIGYLDEFPCDGSPIRIPKPPLASVVWVKYVGTDGVLTTWAAALYEADFPVGPKCSPGRIYPAYAQYYPVTRCQPKAVQIKFTCGYGAAADVPAMLRASMLINVGEQFENREDSIKGTIVNPTMRGAEKLALSYLVKV